MKIQISELIGSQEKEEDQPAERRLTERMTRFDVDILSRLLSFIDSCRSNVVSVNIRCVDKHDCHIGSLTVIEYHFKELYSRDKSSFEKLVQRCKKFERRCKAPDICQDPISFRQIDGTMNIVLHLTDVENEDQQFLVSQMGRAKTEVHEAKQNISTKPIGRLPTRKCSVRRSNRDFEGTTAAEEEIVFTNSTSSSWFQ